MTDEGLTRVTTYLEDRLADVRAILSRYPCEFDARRLAVLDRLLVARPLPDGRTPRERDIISRALDMILDASAETLDAIEAPGDETTVRDDARDSKERA